VLSGNATERLKGSSLSRLVVTDTVFIPEEKKFDRLTVISVAELFARAIMYTNMGASISGLYNGY
jgi:ribose-phosphate pyrophosphokinase